jgi:anthranilate synthase/aminodeoxychorismate synthase-like glutamine amidotransferase
VILLLDNFDSFSFILGDYLRQCGQEVIVRESSGSFDEIISLPFSRVVLSPGPKTPAQSGCLMQMVDLCASRKIPTLGVCLGHQAIGENFGATLGKAIKPMHGKTSVITHNEHLLFTEIPATFQVGRYHSLILTEVDEAIIEITARSEENEIMGISHRLLPLWGVQFHPEAISTPCGLQLLRNWLHYCI